MKGQKIEELLYNSIKNYRHHNLKDVEIIVMNKKDVKVMLKWFVKRCTYVPKISKKIPFYYMGIRVVRSKDLKRGEILIY